MKVLLTVYDLESMPREKSLFLIGVWLILLAYFIGLPTEIKNYLFIATGLLIIFLSYRSSIKDFSDGRKEYQSHEELVHKPTPKPETFVKEPEKKKVITRKIFNIKTETIPEKKVEEVLAVKEEDILQKSISELPSYQKIEDSSFKIRKARIRRKPKAMREEVFGSTREEEKVYTTPSTNIYEEEDDVIVISSDGDK